MRYTKRPITVDALEWTGLNHREMFEFLGGDPNGYITQSGDNFYIDHSKVERGLVIKTLEGEHIASVGDFIIKGIKGEFYPCKPEIFKASYVSGEPETNYLLELKQLQNQFGYVYGDIDAVALLGLFGEAGEVLNEIEIKQSDESLKYDTKPIIFDAIQHAKIVDTFKKALRSKQHPPVFIHIENEVAFNKELADCFYYLHALAINRGLRLNDLAKLSIDKIKSKKEQATG
jgi:NTP pyrophosphatase (non-canonical NTP hydrolase)